MKKIKLPVTAILYLSMAINISAAQETLNNQSILSLASAKVSNQIIINKIKGTPNTFDMSSAGIIDLKKGKISDDVVGEMLHATKNLPVVRNQDVIELNQNKISKNVILEKINLSKCEFNTSTESLIALKEAKVPEAITKVMMDPATSASGTSSNVLSASLPPHPQDIPAPANLTTPGIYYEAYHPKTEYIQVEPTTTNQAKEGGFGQAMGNHFSGGISGTTRRVGLANPSSNTVIEDARPVFYFSLSMDEKDMNQVAEGINDGVASPNDFVLVRTTPTKRGREVEIGRRSAFTNESGFAKGTIPFRFKKVNTRLYRVYFEQDVSAGEYAFYYNKGSEQRKSLKLYDFSLRNNIKENAK